MNYVKVGQMFGGEGSQALYCTAICISSVISFDECVVGSTKDFLEDGKRSGL